MIFNWFRKDKDFYIDFLNAEKSEAASNLVKTQQEYRERLAYFESKLPEDLFEQYMGLRRCESKLTAQEYAFSLAEDRERIMRNIKSTL